MQSRPAAMSGKMQAKKLLKRIRFSQNLWYTETTKGKGWMQSEAWIVHGFSLFNEVGQLRHASAFFVV